MEQSRKHLKIISIVVLVLTVSTILDLIVGLIELNGATIPDGAPANTLMITKIVLMVVSAVLLLPQIYIGFKGIKVANNPDSSKAHIVVAFILFVLSIVDLVSGIVGGVQTGFSKEIVRTALSVIVDVLVYADYIKYARLVAKENNQ
jgi:hypothetical protein